MKVDELTIDVYAIVKECLSKQYIDWESMQVKKATTQQLLKAKSLIDDELKRRENDND